MIDRKNLRRAMREIVRMRVKDMGRPWFDYRALRPEQWQTLDMNSGNREVLIHVIEDLLRDCEIGPRLSWWQG